MFVHMVDDGTSDIALRFRRSRWTRGTEGEKWGVCRTNCAAGEPEMKLMANQLYFTTGLVSSRNNNYVFIVLKDVGPRRDITKYHKFPIAIYRLKLD